MKFITIISLTMASLQSFANVGTSDNYCGEIERDDDGYPTAVTVTDSKQTSNQNVKNVVEKYKSHKLVFTYRDGAHFNTTADKTKGLTFACFQAEAAELSEFGTPIVVFP